MIFADTSVNNILNIHLMFHPRLDLMNLVGLLTSTLTFLKFYLVLSDVLLKKKISFIKLNKYPLNFVSINLEACVWKSQPACKVLRGRNISPFLHRWGVKTILIAQRYTSLKFYFIKQKSENVLSRNYLSFCYGSGGLSKQFPFPARQCIIFIWIELLSAF